MRSGTDFEAAVRRGRRAGSRHVVVHCARTAAPSDPTHPAPVTAGRARVGFVVSRAVGGSVVRHRVARRLREAVRPHLAALPAGALVVVRAQPAAADAGFDDLRDDVTRLLVRVGLLARTDGGRTDGGRSDGDRP